MVSTSIYASAEPCFKGSSEGGLRGPVRSKLAAYMFVLAIAFSLTFGLVLAHGQSRLSTVQTQSNSQEEKIAPQSGGKAQSTGGPAQQLLLRGTIRSFSPTMILISTRIGGEAPNISFLRTGATQVQGTLASNVRCTVYFHVGNKKKIADRLVVFQEAVQPKKQDNVKRAPNIGVAKRNVPGTALTSAARRDPFESLAQPHLREGIESRLQKRVRGSLPVHGTFWWQFWWHLD